MRTLIVFLLLCALTYAVQAQSFQWAKALGDTNIYNDSPNFKESVVAMDFSQDGDIIALVNIYDNTHFDTFAVDGVCAIVKFDSTGEIQWVQPIEMNSGNYLKGDDLAVDDLGNIYIALVSKANSITIGDSTWASLGSSFARQHLIKLTANGIPLWRRSYSLYSATGTPTNSLEKGGFINIMPSGNIVYTNGFRALVGFDTTYIDYTSISWQTYSILHSWYDPSGNLLRYSTTKKARLQVRQVTSDEDENLYVAFNGSHSNEDTIYVGNEAFVPGFPTSSSINGIYKTDSLGEGQWVKPIYLSQNNYLYLNGLEHTSNGLFFFGATQPQYGIQAPFYVSMDQQADSLGFLSSGNRPIFIHLDENDSVDHVETSSQTLGSSSFLSSTTYGDDIYVALKFKTEVQLPSVSVSPNNSSWYGLFLKMNPDSLTFNTHKRLWSNLNLDNVSCMVANEHNLYVGGWIDSTLQFDGDTIHPLGLHDGYIARLYDCHHIAPSILEDSSSACASLQTLNAMPNDSPYSFEWLYNNNTIPNATDSQYLAGVNGQFRVVIRDSACYDTSDVATITVNTLQAGLNIPTGQVCPNGDSVLLTGGSPAGGYYFGTGVNSNHFVPANASTGSNVVYYVVNDTTTGCSDTAFDVITVSAPPTAYFFPSFTEACSGDSLTLTSGLPTGGTYSGAGVTGNVFAPILSDTGSQTLVYTITQSGCSSSDSIMVDVNPSPVVTLNLGTDTTCEAASPILLTGASPSGGTFSGTGVSGSYFIPAIVSPNAYAIAYSVTEDGCTAEAIDTIQVDSFPDVVLPSLDSICLSAVSLPLTHGYPATGVYSGSGISGNNFTASVPGLGTHALTYIFENACAADTAYSTVHVIASPTVSSSITSVSCNGLSDGSIAASVSGGNFPYSYSWNTGDSSATLSGQMAGIYTVTVSGEGGCTANQSFSITEPAVLSLVLDSLDNVVCNGYADGKAYVTTTGGTTTYTYAWTNGITAEDNLTLASGTHTLTVTDANGCEDSLSVNITEVNPVSVSGTVSDVSCYGLSDGSISTTTTGGGGTYSYAWSNGTTTPNASSLATDDYFLTITDQNGCEALDTFTVEQPDSLALSLAGQHVDCYGSANGTLSSTSGGGTPTYSYLWNNGSTADSISGQVAGTYTLTITDQQGCTKTASQEITQPDSISVSISTAQALLCFGDSNGSLNSTASGGTSPYTYSWSNGATAANNSSLIANTYLLTVTDANGCTGQQSSTLSEPAALTIQVDSMNHVNCFGLSDGNIYTQAIGGTSPYAYSWSNGITTANNYLLLSDSYFLTITDTNGCETDSAFTITSPTEINSAFTLQHVTCFGLANGSAQTASSGGAGSYSYNWSNGAGTANNTTLTAGNYILTTTDGDGCNRTDSIIITEPTQMTVGLTAQNNQCYGDSSGSILSSVVGGTQPYGYVWNTGDTTSNAYQLTANTYSLTVTDSNGCEVDTSIQLSQPNPLSLSVDSLSNILCFGDSTGYVAVSSLGGTGSYSYIWSDGNTLAIRNNLTVGSHDITVTDSNGCVSDTTVQLSEPAQMQLMVDSIQHLMCFEDSTGYISYASSGGITPHTLTWSNGTSGNADSLLAAGVYIITLTDSNGCTLEHTDTLYQPDDIVVIDSTTPVTCSNDNDGSITLEAQGGFGNFIYDWAIGFIGDSLGQLHAGQYVITATDDNGCEKEHTVTLTYLFETPVNELGADTGFCAGDSLELSASSSGSYAWNTGDTTHSIWVSQAQQIALTITSSDGCDAVDTVEVVEHALPTFTLGNDTMMCSDSLLMGLPLSGPLNMADYLWSTGTTLSTESVTQFGTHWLSVTDSNGCGWIDSIQVTKDTCTGVFDLGQFRDIVVFPNPTNGLFTVASETTDMNLVVLDVHGQIVLTSPTSRTHHLSLKDEAAGVYIIQVQFDEQTSFYRVIKE